MIEAEKFNLRLVRASDAGLVEMYTSDPRVAKMTVSIPHPLPPGATQAFLTRAMEADIDETTWAIDATTHGGPEVMGLISLQKTSKSEAEIGYWIAPVFWNQGVASAAVAALIQANPFECATLVGSVFQDNPASARVLTANGFAYVGDAEAHSVARAANVPTWSYVRNL